MSQISITAATPVPEPSDGAAVKGEQGNRSLNRAVSSAVSQLNDAGYAGAGREVAFSVDRATRLPVVKVIDSTTKEVIEQWPPEYLLAMAAETAARK